MARKSRRNSSAVKNVEHVQAPTRLKTAIYARISREKDGDCSISTQISMLEKFISEQPDLELTDTYIDNGISGTMFDRPEFNRMMNDVFSGKVQCIAVKDLSRFGRDLIETGNFIENIFPKIGVRFIALTDDFDSFRKEDLNSISVPIKNMVNALYAMDLSRKQVASFELHSRLGDKKIISAPYGFNLNKAENKLYPNEKTSPVVKLIFKWYVCRCGASEIAHRLNDLKVPSPGSHKSTKGENIWTSKTILDILKNEAYIGNLVFGKVRSAYYKHIPTHTTPPKERYIHENTHEAIVGKEVFFAAQVIRENGAKVAFERKAGGKRKCFDRFHLKVKCRECRRTMMYFPNYRYGDAMNGYYRCYSSGKSGDTSTSGGVRKVGKSYNGSLKTDGSRRDCGKKIHEDYVRIAVLDALRNLISKISDMEKVVRKSNSATKNHDIIRIKIAEEQMHLSALTACSDELYTDLTAGILTQNEYRELHENSISAEHHLKENIADLESQLRVMDKKIDNFFRLAKEMNAIDPNDRNSEQSLFDEVVDRIFVNDLKEINVVFKCSEFLDEMEEIIK